MDGLKEFKEKLSNIKIAIFDFDGTISTLRFGWEKLMKPLMLKSIHGNPPYPKKLEEEIDKYIDYSTGLQTLCQMEWLSKKAIDYGKIKALTADEYKSQYTSELKKNVIENMKSVESGFNKKDNFLMGAAFKFLEYLYEKKIKLILFSGTDQKDVEEEAKFLGIKPFFKDNIYGARKTIEEFSKEKLINEILNENKIQNDQILVVGDGPVEIKLAIDNNLLELGIAGNEDQSVGFDQRKLERLKNIGARYIVKNFREIIK